jgi:WhiB family redox-sensing transcriptional regulator
VFYGINRKGRPWSVTPGKHQVTASALGCSIGKISSTQWYFVIQMTDVRDPPDVFTGSLLDAIRAALPAWHADAACTGQPFEVFFPRRGQSSRPALQLCGRCAVRAQCLAQALADPTLDHGIRGGMTVPARKAARRARGLGP